MSSEVTKVTLAESRRLFVTESKLSEYMERKDRKRRGSAGRGERRSRATQRETLTMDGMWMKVKDPRDDLSQCGCDTCVMKARHLTACRRAQTSRMLCLCLSVSLLSLSTLVLKVYLSSYTFA